MTQLPIDFDAPPAQSHSATSQAAGDSVRESAGTLRSRVLELLRTVGHNGATDEEIQRVLGMNPSTQRPRRIELVKAGRVVDSGRVRLTTSGRHATVWVWVPPEDAA